MNTGEPEDESLYTAWRLGDMSAFDILYNRYRQNLYLFLLRGGLNEAIAEDLFHDCWMKIINEQAHFDGKNFRAWIFKLARNLSIDHFRKSHIRSADSFDEQQSHSGNPSAEKESSELDCADLLKSSVAGLPKEQRDVFLLKEEAGLSLEQIAKVMAVGKETIKSRVRYAMKQLRQRLVDCL